MAKKGFKILDSDMHIMEPPDLWERYIDKKFRDRGAARRHQPQCARSAHGLSRRQRVGASDRRAKATSPAAKTSKRTKAFTAKTPNAAGVRQVQLEAMDIEGIDVAVLYPTRGLRALVVQDMDAPFRRRDGPRL